MIMCGPALGGAQTQLEVPGFGSTPISLPFGAGASDRYQQVYAASNFGPIAQGGGLITSLAFQFADSHTLGGGVSNIQINLSTTLRPVDGLSTTFAQNVGSDDTKVFGAGNLVWANDPTVPFSAFINLSTPFHYNPANGNLLVDMRVFQTGLPFQFGSLSMEASAANNDTVSIAYAFNVNDLTGITDTKGLNTLFTVTPVPEPSTICLFLAGLATIGFIQRRQVLRRKKR